MAQVTSDAAIARRGRPRDPDVEDRIFDAAMALYAETGWAGFTFEAIAKASGIGKAAIYRRWTSRGDLLAQTFEARWYQVDTIDSGNLRSDLLELVWMVLSHLTGEYGSAIQHMNIDLRRNPEVRDSTSDYRLAVVRAVRNIIGRAVTRGELPEGTQPSLLIDLVVGGATNHVVSTPAHLKRRMETTLESYATQLVDTVLRGVAR